MMYRQHRLCSCGCGELLDPWDQHGHRWRRFAAGHNSRQRGHWRFRERTCPTCGTVFVRKTSDDQRFCSRPCIDWDRRGRAPKLSTFWKYVDVVLEGDDCWEWKGFRRKNGYGVTTGDGNQTTKRTQMGAHRRSWILTNGPIPRGLFVCHRCDNPPCVRPDHLFLGTHIDNMTDMHAKGREARGERAGIRRLKAQNRLYLHIIAYLIANGIAQ